jgi:hypothetical protein
MQTGQQAEEEQRQDMIPGKTKPKAGQDLSKDRPQAGQDIRQDRTQKRLP